MVTDFLAASGLTYTHLYKLTPRDRKLQEGDPSWLKPRGAEQRNEGLRWLREMGSAAKGKEAAALEEAVVYFADDDNTYSLQLFEEVRVLLVKCTLPFKSMGLVRIFLYIYLKNFSYAAHQGCIYLIKKYSNIILLIVNFSVCFQICIYSFLMAKLSHQQPLLQSSVSRSPSEITLICWFLIIINTEISCSKQQPFFFK